MRLRRFSVVAVAALIAGMFVVVAQSAAEANDLGVSCLTRTLSVGLAAGEPRDVTVVGELCATPAELRSGTTIQFLVHGGTYNHDYWDFGSYGGIRYSYARDVAAAGFPTFSIDEIGTLDEVGLGQSILPSTDVTLESTAYVVHEVVGDLHAGVIGHTRFGPVILVGHSQGSATVWQEAVDYHDVAGLVITSSAHDFTEFAFSELASKFVAAGGDPKFSTRFPANVLDGYLTTAAGTPTRASLFYSPSDSDPAVIAADEKSKDVESATELSGIANLPTTQVISVPVLAVEGTNDAFVCGTGIDGSPLDCSSAAAFQQREAPYYSPAAHLQACVVPGSGHDINLALNHNVEEIDVVSWSLAYVGQRHGIGGNGRQQPRNCTAGVPSR